jgi:hypothetical protein
MFITPPKHLNHLAVSHLPQTKVSDERQVIRRDEREPAAMKLDVCELKRRVVVDMIEVKQGQNTGVTARSSETSSRFRAAEMLTKKS